MKSGEFRWETTVEKIPVLEVKLQQEQNRLFPPQGRISKNSRLYNEKALSEKAGKKERFDIYKK